MLTFEVALSAHIWPAPEDLFAYLTDPKGNILSTTLAKALSLPWWAYWIPIVIVVVFAYAEPLLAKRSRYVYNLSSSLGFKSDLATKHTKGGPPSPTLRGQAFALVTSLKELLVKYGESEADEWNLFQEFNFRRFYHAVSETRKCLERTLHKEIRLIGEWPIRRSQIEIMSNRLQAEAASIPENIPADPTLPSPQALTPEQTTALQEPYYEERSSYAGANPEPKIADVTDVNIVGATASSNQAQMEAIKNPISFSYAIDDFLSLRKIKHNQAARSFLGSLGIGNTYNVDAETISIYMREYHPAALHIYNSLRSTRKRRDEALDRLCESGPESVDDIRVIGDYLVHLVPGFI